MFESKMWRTFLRLNASAPWACFFFFFPFLWWWRKSHSSPPGDERDVCSSLRIHYFQFRWFLHTLADAVFAFPPSSYPDWHGDAKPPLMCHIPLLWLSEVIFTQWRPPDGSQGCSKHSGGQMETNWLDFRDACYVSLTGFLVAHLNIEAFNR